LADLHLNEVVLLNDTIGMNEFNYDIAAKRLQKYADKAINLLEHQGVTTVLVAMTGDMLNSDRRLDELLTNAGNRSQALVVAVDLLQQFLRQLADHFSVAVVSICGNESRKDLELGSTSKLFTHNYDYDIHMMLDTIFNSSDADIVFLPITDAYEMLVDVLGRGILFVHGHQYDSAAKVQEAVARDVAKFARAGKSVDYTIFGHIHCTHISDAFARSASLVGGNAYSGHKLLVSSTAAQNVHVVESDSITTTAINLQNCDDYVGYKYHKNLTNGSGMRKSVDKARDNKTVFKLVI
jgi:predicted phosphodiesterase